MTKVFISYRQQDTQDATLRIREGLANHFGVQHVFMDTGGEVGGGIPYGEDFEKYIQGKLEWCDVFIEVIGPSWAETRGAVGAHGP